LVTSAPGSPTREVHDHQEGVEPRAVTLPAFTPLEESLFLTLYARALDNRSPHSILAAAMADELVHKLDYDFGQLHIDTNLILNVALRAKKLDQVASEFLARHPDAVGLDLGAGLDTRMERLAPRPPSTGMTSTSPPSSPLESA
jgi:O-methyltransferase involved in polyketide biosynthesis